MQSHREQALAEFKEGKYRILIATDVAGRGIHVEGVAHVVNYDLPMWSLKTTFIGSVGPTRGSHWARDDFYYPSG